MFFEILNTTRILISIIQLSYSPETMPNQLILCLYLFNNFTKFNVNFLFSLVNVKISSFSYKFNSIVFPC